MSTFLLLELERVRVDGSRYATAWVNVDDPAHERAYRVEVLYDRVDESIDDARATRTWGTELVERDIKPEERRVAGAIEAFVRADQKVSAVVYDEVARALREYVDDRAAQDAWDRHRMRTGH